MPYVAGHGKRGDGNTKKMHNQNENDARLSKRGKHIATVVEEKCQAEGHFGHVFEGLRGRSLIR